MKKGHLIVIEGIDGSGKTTQMELLKQALDCEVISFPRYEDNIYGKLIKRYLEGEFGGINQVNPYLMALTFAGDRFLAKPLIEKWLSEGKIVLANRYVSSSKAHLGANLPEKIREEFFKWLGELEYQTNGLPRADLTVLLSVDPKIAQTNVLGGGPDIHEEDLKHLEQANRIYLRFAKEENSWYVVDCMNNRAMKTREEIHQEIMHILQ